MICRMLSSQMMQLSPILLCKKANKGEVGGHKIRKIVQRHLWMQLFSDMLLMYIFILFSRYVELRKFYMKKRPKME